MFRFGFVVYVILTVQCSARKIGAAVENSLEYYSTPSDAEQNDDDGVLADFADVVRPPLTVVPNTVNGFTTTEDAVRFFCLSS